MELTPELQEKKRLMIDGLKKTYKVQYDAVQPIPYIKDRLYCVDKVFVEGGVEVCLSSELTRDTGGSWERLESYKNIYTDSGLDFKRRIIQGEPGYGKSTLTLQLAYDWCNDIWNSSMRNVEILILLRLRQLGGIQSIYRAIKLFLLADERRVTVDDIKNIIQSSSSVNIILDGYDEYPHRDSNNHNDVDKMIMMKLFQNVDVTVTTRYLPKRLIRETKRAKLTGFDEEARDEYIRKAVVGYNEEAVEQIKRRLYENSVLADICQVPLIFVMFAHMAHDLKHSMKFTSVTQFFKYMIRCFHEHLKRKFKDTRHNMFYNHETEHHELDKIAFEGLNMQNQQLTWKKETFQESVSQALYEQYILIGILVEEQVVSGFSVEGDVLYTTEVRFYHKLFCEWYAAHYFVSVVMTESYLENALRFLDPFDLQYLYRFACGLHPDAGKKLIGYLKSRPGGDTFAILCILEQTGDVNDIMDSIKELCSRDVKIQKGDSALLQRSTTQLLEIASNNNIPISCLHLDYSSIKFEGDTIILHSGISLPKLPTLEKIHIAGGNAQHDDTETNSGISFRRQYRQYDDAQSANQETLSGISYRRQHRRHGYSQSANHETLTEKDILFFFPYGIKCRRIKELMFDQLQLPTSVPPDAFTDTMTTRNIRVRWRPFDIDFHLDLQSGHWEVDDSQKMQNICSSIVCINATDSKLQQGSTLQLLHVAHRHNIPITCLYLKNSFSTIDAGIIILKSGLHLSCPASVKKVLIEKKGGREMTETEFVDILMFVHQSHMLEELEFDQLQLPTTVSPEAFTDIIRLRNIRVRWRPFDIDFHLDLQNGNWEFDNINTLRQLCSGTIHICKSDDTFKQKYTIMLINIASSHDIPISCLNLKESFSKIDAGDVILHSGLRLSCPVSVKKVVINTYGEGREMTETEFVHILMFVQQSHLLDEVEFEDCLLPLTFSSDSIPAEMQSREIKVSWNNYGYSLNLQSGVWEVDDKDTVESLCREDVDIYCDDSELLQRCNLKLLENASYHDIPITSLYLQESFSKTDAGEVILHSGLRLSCPVSVKKISISTFLEGREMTETEVIDILMFVQQSHMLEELKFSYCLLPQSIPAESIPSILKTRNVEVSWRSGHGLLELNLQSGRWMYRETRKEITDTEYNDTVRNFRTSWGRTEWQKARLVSEKK